MSLTMIVTNAGRAALVNAANTGTAPVTIATCGISASAVVPAVGATTLPGEIKRIATLSGDVVADDTIHLVVRDEGSSVFTLRSFALYLADGTLFAIYGQATPILEKSAQSIMLLALDVRFADVAATSLTFGDANFLNPPATPDQIGVVELATLAEQLAGTDDRRVAAAKTIKDAVFSWLDARFGANNAGIWHPGNDGAGSGLDADLLDGQQGSYYTAIAARLGYTPANKAGDTFGGPVAAPAFNFSTLANAGFLVSGGNPYLGMDLGDSLFYDRIGDAFGFNIGNVTQASIGGDGYINTRVGMRVGGNIVWHAGNDGSGSGLDADTVDGLQGAQLMTIQGDDTSTGRKILKTNRTGNNGISTSAANLGELEVQGNGVGAAMMSFHRPGTFASYLGLEVDNSWRVGGWSMGNNSYLLWHSGNDGAGSGLDADLLDGQDSSFYVNIPARLGYTPVRKTGDTFTGDVQLLRASNPAVGLLYLGDSGSRYLYYDGASYIMPGGELYGNGGGKMWHSQNDGSGSGLDADMLDGYHAASFAPIMAEHLVENGGYIVYANGRKEAWGVTTVAANAYGAWAIPEGAGFTTWVHPSYAYIGRPGASGAGDNTSLSSVTTAQIGLYNAEDVAVTVWIRVIGV